MLSYSDITFLVRYRQYGHCLQPSDSILFELRDKSSPVNYAQYNGVAPQNGDRIATTDVTSFHPMYMLRPRVRLSVCPSACPSVTSWSSNKTAKRWIKQATPHDSLESSFLRPKILVKFQWVTPNEDVKWTAGKKILRLSTDNSRWLKNGIRQVHTFYERRIGSHIRCIE